MPEPPRHTERDPSRRYDIPLSISGIYRTLCYSAIDSNVTISPDGTLLYRWDGSRSVGPSLK